MITITITTTNTHYHNYVYFHQNRPINPHTILVSTVSPTRRQTKRDIQKTPIFASTAGVRSSIYPKLCMLIENVVTILKGVNHFSIQRIVLITSTTVSVQLTGVFTATTTSQTRLMSTVSTSPPGWAMPVFRQYQERALCCLIHAPRRGGGGATTSTVTYITDEN